MSRPSGMSQRERDVLEEELAAPLRRLRRTAGDPTYERIAKESGLCRNTVDNAFNARRLVRWDSVEAIVAALGGDTVGWRQRWVVTRDRVDAVRKGPEQAAPEPETDGPAAAPSPKPEPEPLPEPSEAWPDRAPAVRPPAYAAPVTPRAPRTGRRRLLAAGAVATSVFGWVVAAVLASGVMHGQRADAAPGAVRERVSGESLHATSAAQVLPVSGEPVYSQCSDRGRSILTKPGRVRGGMLRGRLRPGERFVVTSKTAYWRFGRVPGASGRQGWVMAEYLCRISE